MLEVGYGRLCVALIDDVAVGHQDQTIKEEERFRTGRMNRADDGLSL